MWNFYTTNYKTAENFINQKSLKREGIQKHHCFTNNSDQNR